MFRRVVGGVVVGKKQDLCVLGSLSLVSILMAGTDRRAAADATKSETVEVRSFLAGPSLYETGRVGAMTVSDQGSRIERTPERAMPKDLVVRRRQQEGDDASSSALSGSVNSSLLAQELRAPLAALNGCRIDVARLQQVAWNDVPAGRLTLQWTILPTGAVADVDVIAIDPIDLHVLDCVRQRVVHWSFSRPRGGAVHLSRAFAFRWRATPVVPRHPDVQAQEGPQNLPVAALAQPAGETAVFSVSKIPAAPSPVAPSP